MKRVFTVLVSFLFFGAVFVFDWYESFPPPLQLIGMKWFLVSTGVLLAHIDRKVLFPYVDLNKPLHSWSGGHYVAISFYIIFPIAFALGG